MDLEIDVVDLPKHKIGYSENGGIFIGRNIQADFHRHHLIAIVLSFGEPFAIVAAGGQTSRYEAALIPQDTEYRLSTSMADDTVFIHLDPYFDLGLQLNQATGGIRRLHRPDFEPLLAAVRAWLAGSDNTSQQIDSLLQGVVAAATSGDVAPRKIDARVRRCIELIRAAEVDEVRLAPLAAAVHLSPGRLSHLFKEETGLTFRQFVQHRKLVKSLQAMYERQSLTDASFTGGFSDQPHFSRTFKKSFGITPSASQT